VVPAGAAGLDPFVASIFVWALMGFANIYYGLARYTMDRAVETVRNKRSIGLSRSMAYHAEVQHAIAEMAIEIETIEPALEQAARDWSENSDPERIGALVKRVLAVKYRAVEGSWRVVDLALDVAGGFGIFRSAGLERVFRDARLGRIHPANNFLTHEFLAKLTLGINPDEQPRWG
jgi:alkylation response protein AidB-like acyl-CoA dehydrogenase